jgi:glycosyltransferase involved in cell wall biosynthesis
MVIHNGVWLKKIKNQKLRKIFNVRSNVIKVGMLARLEKYKGQIDLIEGFNNLPQDLKDRYKVFFIGSGTEKELNNLKFKITEYNLKKYFKILKYIKGDSLSVIKNLDLLVSLTRDFEGFGYSIAESLYVGTPILSTNVGGVNEFLNDKNSKLIKPMDISAISKSLKDFAYRRKVWKKRAYAGKKLIIKRFNSEIMSRKFLKEFLKDLNLYKHAI